MSVQFILGKSGSGKTTYTYEKILKDATLHPQQNFFVIVPEQFTLETQKELVKKSPGHGIMNVDVLSFHRLAYRIFEETPGLIKTILEDTGKSMILRKVLSQHENELLYFKRGLKGEGFIDELKSLFSELYQYKVDEDTLEELIESSHDHPLMQQKLKDIALILEAFTSSMENNYMTAEELLPLLATVVGHTERLKNSVFVFDEFTGFTPCQYDVLRELCKVTEKIYITATIDAREDLFPHNNPYQLFYLSKDTFKHMADLCQDEGITFEQPLFVGKGEGKLPHRFEGRKDLEALEHNIFRYPSSQYKEQPEAVKISCHRSPKAEVEFVAREIERLVREEGYRYRDLAVITGAMEDNENILSRALTQMNIPFFMDTKKSMVENTFSQLILSLLHMFVYGMDYENTFSFLRSGLSPLTDEETDLIENSVLASGIRGYSRWNSEWKNKDEEINRIRECVMRVVEPFYQVNPEQKHTVKEFTKALDSFIKQGEYEEKLAQRAEQFEQAGETIVAKEYGMVYDAMYALFEQAEDLMGDEEVSLDEYTQILETGMDSLELGFVPPGNDTVIIGDVIRTRLKRVKILFFINVNDKIVPKGAKSPGLLSTRERELVAEHKIQLAPDAREGMFSEQFYLYANMTKPSERLYVTYSRLDGTGSTQRPSYLIDRLTKLFPQLVVDDIEKRPWQPSDILGMDNGFSYLLGHMKDAKFSDEAKQLYAEFKRDKQLKDRMNKILDAWKTKRSEGKLSSYVTKLIYGDVLFGSVTRLELYGACPFAHFAKYGLDLRERKVYEIALPDLGNVFHHALERISGDLMSNHREWSELKGDDFSQLANDAIDHVVNEYNDTLFYETKRSEFIIHRMKRILTRTVWAIHEQMKRGDYKQSGYELEFGKLDHLDEVHLDLGEGKVMNLSGRIDRVDTLETDDDIYVRVVDYKTGSTSFDIGLVYYGLQMQLTVYLDTAMALERKQHEDKQIKPGGVLYYHIKDPVVRVMDQDAGPKDLLEQLKLDGYVNDDKKALEGMDKTLFETKGQSVSSLVTNVSLNKSGEMSSKSQVMPNEDWSYLLHTTRERMKEFGKNISQGDVRIAPYKLGERVACSYCPYGTVCGFNPSQGDEFRELPKVGRSDINVKAEQFKAERSEADDKLDK